MKCLCHFPVEYPAFVSERNAVGKSLEQTDIKMLLKPRQHATDSGLGNTQIHGSLGEAAASGGSLEHKQCIRTRKLSAQLAHNLMLYQPQQYFHCCPSRYVLY